MRLIRSRKLDKPKEFTRLNSSGVEQWIENPCVGGSNPPLGK